MLPLSLAERLGPEKASLISAEIDTEEAWLKSAGIDLVAKILFGSCSLGKPQPHDIDALFLLPDSPAGYQIEGASYAEDQGRGQCFDRIRNFPDRPFGLARIETYALTPAFARSAFSEIEEMLALRPRKVVGMSEMHNHFTVYDMIYRLKWMTSALSTGIVISGEMPISLVEKSAALHEKIIDYLRVNECNR